MNRRLLLVIALVIFLLLPVSTPLRDSTSRFVAPVSRFLVRQDVRLHNFFTAFSQISTLHTEQSRLQQEVISLEQQLSDQETIKRENTTLRQELHVTGIAHTARKILAHTILQGSDPLDRTVTIDVGSNQGIKNGQPAVAQGALIGQIILVRPNSSVVRYLTSRESHVQAWIAESREKGRIVGDGYNAYLSDVTQGVTVAPSSLVESSGLGGELPQGIVIGQIVTLQSKATDLSQKFLIQLSQDPASSENMFILDNNSGS